MVTQYPHTLTYTNAVNPVRDAAGDYVLGAASTTGKIACRLERAGGGYVSGQGGVQIDFAWAVYCQKTSIILPVGTLVTVRDEESRVIATDTVKQFSPGQLNTRLWL